MRMHRVLGQRKAKEEREMGKACQMTFHLLLCSSTTLSYLLCVGVLLEMILFFLIGNDKSLACKLRMRESSRINTY